MVVLIIHLKNKIQTRKLSARRKLTPPKKKKTAQIACRPENSGILK
jgi:hypothetical protein